MRSSHVSLGSSVHNTFLDIHVYGIGKVPGFTDALNCLSKLHLALLDAKIQIFHLSLCSFLLLALLNHAAAQYRFICCSSPSSQAYAFHICEYTCPLLCMWSKCHHQMCKWGLVQIMFTNVCVFHVFKGQWKQYINNKCSLTVVALPDRDFFTALYSLCALKRHYIPGVSLHCGIFMGNYFSSFCMLLFWHGIFQLNLNHVAKTVTKRKSQTFCKVNTNSRSACCSFTISLYNQFQYRNDMFLPKGCLHQL